MTNRFNFWIVLACLVLIGSPLVQGLVSGTGLNPGAILVAAVIGAVALIAYLRLLSRTRRDLDS